MVKACELFFGTTEFNELRSSITTVRPSFCPFVPKMFIEIYLAKKLLDYFAFLHHIRQS